MSEQGGVKVTDRRRFAESDAGSAGADPGSDADGAEAGGATGAHGDESTGGAGEPLADADFTTLVLSLRESALMLLGVLTDSGESRADLPAARFQIDLLAMLETKTRGNLSADEERLLRAVLYELRMGFVKAGERRG